MNDTADQTSINFGQIIAVAVIGYLVFRWFTSPTSSSTPTSSRNAGRQVNPQHVEQIAAMFPQLDRRTIMWDLQRNGGSVPATTERILTGRGLDLPPPSFQPPIPQPAALPVTPVAQVKPTNPDLITRYNLSTKVKTSGEPVEVESTTTGSKSSGWSANKTERADALKRRREDMVLAARRKMEERDRLKTGSTA